VHLLDGCGASIDSKNVYGETALLVAVSKGQDKIVESLLLHGADVNSINKDKVTPLMYSATNGFRTMTALLDKKNGAGVNREARKG